MHTKNAIDRHLMAFVESFVLDSRKERWLNLFSERPDRITSQASKLFNYLEHNFIEKNDALENVSTDDTVRVFYDFENDPGNMSFADAKKNNQTDALFSIIPGELVIYFFHDGWNFVCKK